MKKYTLSILTKNEGFDKVEGDTLIELMSKLLILITQIADKEKKATINDDDIPF